MQVNNVTRGKRGGVSLRKFFTKNNSILNFKIRTDLLRLFLVKSYFLRFLLQFSYMIGKQIIHRLCF